MRLALSADEISQLPDNYAARASDPVEHLPLDLLSETAREIQEDQELGLFENELDRRTLFRESELQRLGGQFALAAAWSPCLLNRWTSWGRYYAASRPTVTWY